MNMLEIRLKILGFLILHAYIPGIVRNAEHEAATLCPSKLPLEANNVIVSKNRSVQTVFVFTGL